jgi:hypothetical protein
MDYKDSEIKRLKIARIVCSVIFCAIAAGLLAFGIMLVLGRAKMGFAAYFQCMFFVFILTFLGRNIQIMKRKIGRLEAEKARELLLRIEAARIVERERLERQSAAPVVREKIIEKVKVVTLMRCSHCGTKYDEKLPNCPNCGGE